MILRGWDHFPIRFPLISTSSIFLFAVAVISNIAVNIAVISIVITVIVIAVIVIVIAIIVIVIALIVIVVIVIVVILDIGSATQRSGVWHGDW